jgi:glycosyltransferase involved in cell wall biosynthesis
VPGTLVSHPVPSDPTTASERPLSILHVLAPAPAGGLERVVQALARGQARRGHRVTVAPILTPPRAAGAAVAALTRAGEQEFLSAFDGTTVTVSPVAVGGRAYWQERARVAAIAGQCGALVAHTHGYRPDVVDAGALRALGVPVATTVHGFTGGGWRNRLYELAQRRAFRRLDAVVAVSDAMAAGLLASGLPATRLHVIPNAYAAPSPPLSRDAARAELGVPRDAFVIGWVGRLSREKGLDVLFDALMMLHDRPVVSVVIGEGRERSRLEAQASALPTAVTVRWSGLVCAAHRLYRAFDVFVLSSRTEGTPIALFEAMDAGVPIVATAVGGVPAVVTPSEAILVPSDHPTALAEALRAVSGDPSGARLRAAAASQRLVAAYGVDSWLARYDAVYDGIIGLGSGAHRPPVAPRRVTDVTEAAP